ncbi:MAG: aminoacyl-tRNA hydrolase [Lachnospiraceae bacterium]|nr:aminoacyl-tRNA hydrolase [Lachnospiraceae bacterium]
MIIIAGLGNPGKDYAGTRHNAGFMTIDALASKYGIDVGEKKHKALIGKGAIEGHKVILAKPQTFMNNSGESLRELVDYYKPDIETEVIVIYDDITLDVGGIRVRKKGSAGGHNGMKSIIAHLGTTDFQRVRVGIGEKPPRMDLADWVLGHFHKEDMEPLKDAIDEACTATLMIMNGATDEAMNKYNRKVDRTQE